MKIGDTYTVNCNFFINVYKLIKGDEIQIVDVSEYEVKINQTYFARPIWIEKLQLEIHCSKKPA